MRDFNKYMSSPQLADKAIYVSVPATIAFDLQSMNKITASVLNRLGCPECHSGFDIRFDMERRFIFNEQGEFMPGR